MARTLYPDIEIDGQDQPPRVSHPLSAGMDRLRDRERGARVLIVGCGPSGADWREYLSPDMVLIACNGSIDRLADRAQYSICMEVPGELMRWWYQRPANGVRVINSASVERARLDIEKGYAAAACRSWHIMGWNPREYVNPRPITEEAWLAAENPYTLHGNDAEAIYPPGFDPETMTEAGLLKGPAHYRREAVGSILLQALNLAAYIGAASVDSIGFELHFRNGVQHWLGDHPFTSPPWPPEEFVHVNGMQTTWYFALSAAYCASKRSALAAAGLQWTDHSAGLMDIVGIETLLEQVKSWPPASTEL